MCKCGCNTCETKTKGPLLTEGKVKSLLSEGLQYHIDKKIPLFETVYRIGSDKHLALIKEARKMYSRNVIDLCEEDKALIGTHLGEFALYEGVAVPLDLPMLNEIDEDDEYEIASRKLFDMTWDEVRRQNSQDMVQDVHDEVSKDDEEDWDDDDNMYTLRESYDYDEVAQSEFGMDYDQLGSGEKEWVRDEIDNMSMNEFLNEKQKPVDLKTVASYYGMTWFQFTSLSDKKRKEFKEMYIKHQEMNESDSNYPDFDLNKNIRYQDTSISSGMWRYTGKEQGGKGVYRNLNNGQILGFDRSDFDIFRNNLSSHFDISESINESKMPTQDQVDKFFALTQNEMHYLNSKPVAGQEKTFNKMEVEPWDEYDLSNFNALVRKAKSKGRINEAIKNALTEKKSKKTEKKDPPLNKPKRGGSKAYYVYVRDPKTKKIKKVSFGSGGLRAKIKNKKARNAFAARHNCKNKKDRTKAGYWSCNLPRYAPALGLGAKMNTFW